MTGLGPDDLDALRKVLGDDAVETHEPVDVDGVALGATLRPADGAALARAVEALGERALPAVVRGGGTRLGLGNPPRGARLLLSTAELAGIETLDAEEGVVRARAGTRLHEVREAAEEAGWEVPFDPPGAGATVGGVLAAAAVGPRHLGYGRPRDVVLGLGVVLGDGARTRCGGRVVKNVTGYDLIKLQIGALGTLGVIEDAWLRLRARPETTRVLSAALGDDDEAFRCGLDAARLGSARAAALIDASLAPAVDPTVARSSGLLLLVELAGDEPVVARDAARLAETAGAQETGDGALARLRGLQGGSFGPDGLRFRLTCLPSRLSGVVAALTAAGAATLSYAGSGLVFARFALEIEVDGAGADAAWQAASAAARGGGGHATLECAPAWAKQGRDVFGDPAPGGAIARALKQRFDPSGVLNPGRFAGGL